MAVCTTSGGAGPSAVAVTIPISVVRQMAYTNLPIRSK